VKKCPVCGKDRSEFEMRPLVNVEELAVGDAMSDQDSKQDVGGARVHVVCRSCWLALLDGKSKAEVMELLETICGILFEVAKARDERAKGFIYGEPAVLIEKMQQFPQLVPAIGVQPFNPCPTVFPPNSTGCISVSSGTGATLDSVSSNRGNNIQDLAVQWRDTMFGEDCGSVSNVR